MEDKQLKQILEAVAGQVEITVNGNIRDIKVHLEKQDVKMEEMDNKIDKLKKETAPIIESKRVFVGMRNFIVWIATPIVILYAVLDFLTR